MSLVASGARRAAVNDSELQACLADGLPSRFGSGATIAGLRRTPFDGATSYPAEVVRVRLSTGRRLRLFLKDLSASRLPKDGIRDRREREFRVYRDLLSRADVESARYYGALCDESLDRLCLLLEFVDGVQLDGCEFECWCAAAGWLARLQGALARHADAVERSAFLVRHDARFFRAKAELAERAVGQVSPALARRLSRGLDAYDPIVAVMARQPRTLAHGSYRPENILVVRRSSSARICPIDWELAAWGAPLYDLAFLSDAVAPSQRVLLWDSYAEEAARCGVSVPPRDELRHVVDCFRLHKTLKALSECVSWAFPERKVARLVAMAEAAASDAIDGEAK
jgi:aminoglycoside phosphotransferase (APT) family kinase protein